MEVMEFWYDLENNLFKLQFELKSLKCKHHKYRKFTIKDPKHRIIHKARVKDRIVHTLVAKKLEEIYQPIFIVNSYACQQERGVHKALNDAIRLSRKTSKNYKQNFWYLKMDIRKFFDNIDHQILMRILQRKIKDKRFLWIIKQIVNSFYNKERGKGLPLGNFTSQWLANIYLNELDYFVKHDLKIKYYLRYADDIIIINDDKIKLNERLSEIGYFLSKNLRLTLHPDKVFIKKFSSGIDWVGYRILPRYVILKKQTKKRMLGKLGKHAQELFINEVKYCQDYEILSSYLGLLKHCNSFELSNKIIHRN